MSSTFHHDLHVQYIQSLASKIDSPSSYEGAVTEHLRMSGIYWSLTALSLVLSAEEVDKRMNLTSNGENTENIEQPSIIDFVFECFDKKSGGFGGNLMQDGHILYTLSAIQILALANALEDVRFLEMKPKVILFIQSLQQKDGGFCGDQWGEIDTRFSYCALSAISICGELDSGVIDVNKAAEYVASCQNFDGGFGCFPGAESHAGQIFTCVGALSIACRLDLLKDEDLLCWWLAERQCDSGGLNGRPEKQADVCYSWWILSSLCILGRVDWIRGDKLVSFIMKCQDDDDGGIADRPGDMVDVFHTFFGIAGLSLIGVLHEHDSIVHVNESDGGQKRKEEYRMIDPVYALPTDVVQKLGLKGQIAIPRNGSMTDDRLKYYGVYNADESK
jgi:geranylgeranyl transferase type-2 subunit beta